MKNLNIIGCGKVGQCLGALLVEQQVVDQVTICNRSIESATRAQRILGSAAIVEQISQLPCADLWMIACDDRAIPGVVETLAGLTTLSADACIFHVSGALDSHVLEPLSCSGAALGTLHPIRSFADPEHAFRAFPGTVCAVEGDARAVRSLTELCEKIGGGLLRLRLKRRCYVMPGMYLRVITSLLCSMLLRGSIGVRGSPNKLFRVSSLLSCRGRLIMY